MRSSYLLLAGVIAAPATAGTVTVTIPRLPVAEYHRPYVAIWLEPAVGGAARTLAVWYDVKKGGKEPGTKWLSDLRAWWRKGGRSLALPANGISGATRAPGQYSVALPADLRPGAYVLNVEAARETGGRELVTVPLTVPNGTARTTGKTELGAVTLAAR
ncbi:DUF2271 domain-containing protein [Sphingomonas prati]|uniref:DUF2271 domain-containing protein n=1 Tax=Sphingomonas prati TaxID=1843237 RepID=A0A7W9F2H2_9SPHN|nr:DUF2271 domain-containing protein [Sphingomonas prati]MBB5728495.1 hypothetical protein [Sphingomonas prati]GGE73338.1 hypothetical protein GCM10011404_02320 [Sphingomonas prati]